MILTNLEKMDYCDDMNRTEIDRENMLRLCFLFVSAQT